MFWLHSHHHHISILDCISWFVLIYFLKKNYAYIITWCQIWCMIETSSDLLQSSSATYGSLRKMSGNVREMFGNVHLAFGPSLENLRKSGFGEWSEIFGKSPQTSLYIANILYNKKKITWSLGDTKFIFSC